MFTDITPPLTDEIYKNGQNTRGGLQGVRECVRSTDSETRDVSQRRQISRGIQDALVTRLLK